MNEFKADPLFVTTPKTKMLCVARLYQPDVCNVDKNTSANKPNRTLMVHEKSGLGIH